MYVQIVSMMMTDSSSRNYIKKKAQPNKTERVFVKLEASVMRQ